MNRWICSRRWFLFENSLRNTWAIQWPKHYLMRCVNRSANGNYRAILIPWRNVKVVCMCCVQFHRVMNGIADDGKEKANARTLSVYAFAHSRVSLQYHHTYGFFGLAQNCQTTPKRQKLKYLTHIHLRCCFFPFVISFVIQYVEKSIGNPFQIISSFAHTLCFTISNSMKFQVTIFGRILSQCFVLFLLFCLQTANTGWQTIRWSFTRAYSHDIFHVLM